MRIFPDKNGRPTVPTRAFAAAVKPPSSIKSFRPNSPTSRCCTRTPSLRCSPPTASVDRHVSVCCSHPTSWSCTNVLSSAVPRTAVASNTGDMPTSISLPSFLLFEFYAPPALAFRRLVHLWRQLKARTLSGFGSCPAQRDAREQLVAPLCRERGPRAASSERKLRRDDRDPCLQGRGTRKRI